MGLIAEEIFDILIEIILTLILYSHILTSSKKRLYTCPIILCIVLIISYFFIDISNLGLIDFLLGLFIVFILLENKWYYKIVSFIIIYTSCSLVYQGLALTRDFIFQQPIFSSMTHITQRIYCKAATVLILLIFLCLKVIYKYSINFSLRNEIVISIIVCIISSLLTFLSFSRNELSTNISNILAVFLITSIMCVLIYLTTISQKNIVAERNKEKEQYIEALKSYYEEVKRNDIITKKAQHDFVNHLNIVKHLIINGKLEDAQNYLEQININMISNFKKSHNLGNALVNAIVAQKINEYPDVTLICKGSMLPNLPLSEFDLCTILVNLLDNAFEYTQKNKLGTIYLYLFCENSSLLIHIINNVTSDFTLKSLARSSKKEANHGFGITNAIDSLKRNGGTLSYNLLDNKLTVEVKLIRFI